MPERDMDAAQWALLELLTRYVDGQLPEEKAEAVRQLERESRSIRRLLERLEETTGRLQQAILAAPRETADEADETETDAVPPETLALLSEGKLPPEAIRDLEEKLLRSDSLLRLLCESFRSSAALRSGGWPDVPEATRRDLDATLPAPLPPGRSETEEKPSAEEEWRELHIDLKDEERRRQTLSADPYTLLARWNPAGTGGACRIEFEIHGPRPGGGRHQVTVTRDDTGRKLLSAASDAQGRLSIPRLPAGEYTLHLAATGIKVGIRIEG